MATTFRPAADPNGFLPRFVRFIVGLVALVGFFSGADAAPKIADLTQSEIEARLGEAGGSLQKFVTTLEESLLSGQIADTENLVDRDAILTRATQHLYFEGDETVRDLFCDSTRRAWDERGITRDYAGTKFRFLRATTMGARGGLLFRSSGKNGSINYALFTLNEIEPGDYRISDIFIVGLNEFLSDTLRRTWLNVAAGFLGDKAATIKGGNRDYVAHIGEIAAMSRELNDGKFEEVLKAARALPVSVQRERTILLMCMDAAERISIEERNAVYAEWLRAYPDEMDLPLKFVDFYVTQHRWDDAERVLRGLISRLGEDAMLKMELGSVVYRREYEKAQVAATGLSVR